MRFASVTGAQTSTREQPLHASGPIRRSFYSSRLLLSRVPSVLAMFLLGLYVSKRGVLERLGDHLPLSRRVRAWGLGLGLLTSFLVSCR